jgi:hypothetical protein
VASLCPRDRADRTSRDAEEANDGSPGGTRAFSFQKRVEDVLPYLNGIHLLDIYTT